MATKKTTKPETTTYDNSLSGALFKNDKQGHENWPDYQGKIETESGQTYWIAGWIRKSKKGETYMSLALTKPENPETKGDDGDIPF